ncbi:DEAD/DEAH box helicase, partial [Filomicrobium sp.]|uniref:DEAD/DEAH box helicase n=1 Tax=Filomicrobium sp. TaxID=2024831 RepID=UPI00258ECEAC
MASSSPTIAETVSEIRSALRNYIEATYHIGHPALVRQRRALLEREGVVHRPPYLESTPRYTPGRRFSELDIPEPAKALFASMANSTGHPMRSLVFDPPYSHQAEALEAISRDRQSVVITTGTGSGKTEAFLFPTLAKLAVEAHDSPASFQTASLRAILLYPMNALVNDQLGRLRLLFGDPRVAGKFIEWAGRPARFARYTSRTLYPGIRTVKKDGVRLKSIERFYVSLLDRAADAEDPEQERAKYLIAALRERGKWPAKPDLQAWFGSSGDRWLDRNGEFQRAVMRQNDPELLTRHEVLANPPDVLVTNYSMLEYMLMRPLERPIFDATRDWLAANPDERLLLIVDEAHLYRGAAGAEVGLLLRRLRARLGVAQDRIQVICTSASFNDREYARQFGAQLSGQNVAGFRTIRGELALRPGAESGTDSDASELAGIPLEEFYEATSDAGRIRVINGFLRSRGVTGNSQLGQALYAALASYAPMSLLVNLTMQAAWPLDELGSRIFPTADRDVADRATTALVALGSLARQSPGEPGILPCRVHAFFRGLPGLWACIDDNCTERDDQFAGSPVGSLYAQPLDVCGCGARIFELFTCRNCGSAYARAYTDNLDEPRFLWNAPGGGFESVTGHIAELAPLDILLEEPTIEPVEPVELDMVTGRLNPARMGDRVRRVFIQHDRTESLDGDDLAGAASPAGAFRPCGVCNERAGYGRSTVQDHQTKGDQPFQALVTRQIQVQPPGAQPYSDFAPLRGRKVLVFSDSRQTAARLAPNLQTYSLQDALRPLALRGWKHLESLDAVAAMLNLDDLYLAVLIGAQSVGVRLRPQLKGTETLHAIREVQAAADLDVLSDGSQVLQLVRTVGAETVPQSLLRGIVTTVTDRYYGFESLALASVRERPNLEPRLLASLPPLAGFAEVDGDRMGLVRAWLGQWTGQSAGIWFQSMDPSWWQTHQGVRAHSGKFAAFDRWLSANGVKSPFERQWLPILLDTFCELVAPRKYKMRAANLGLDVGGDWAYCQACRTTQRPFAGQDRCMNCGRSRVATIDPEEDPVFAARKGYYR